MLHPVVDPGLQAECQPVARGVDRVDHRVDLVGLERGEVQDRAEHLALQIRDPVHASPVDSDDRAAQVADGWFMYPRQDPDDKAQASISVFRQAAAEAGRAPDSKRRTTGLCPTKRS